VSTTRQAGDSRVRVGLVGCGRISAYHLAALHPLAGVEVVAVCDLDEKLARRTASRYGIPRCYGDMETMMQETSPDVVHLLTPPHTHLALARIAARHRAHMYIEKPFAVNEAEARELLELGREAGVQICPGHSRLFDPAFVEACRRVRSGEIGRVISVRAEQGFTYEASARSAVIPWSYSYDWGTFDNLICHPLYLACHFFSEPGRPQVAAFNTGSVREAGVEEIRVLIPSKTGIAEVSLSLSSSPEVNRVEIVGTQGRIMADWQTMTVLTSRASGLPSALSRFTANFGTAADLAKSGMATLFGIATGRVKRYVGLRTIIARFYEALRANGAPPVPAEEGVLNARLMDQIKEACEAVQKQRPTTTTEGDTQPRILVTGGSGFLGGRLVEVLSGQRTPVRATTRLVSRARQLPGVQWVRCDLAEEEGLRDALAGMETVIHCAALCGPPGSLEEYEDANVRGTLRLVRLAAEAGIKNFVYVSSMSVYAAPRGTSPLLDESSPYDGRADERGAYTRSKLAADAAVLEYARNNPSPRIIVLRPGTIYGPGAKLPVGRFQLPSSSARPLIAGSSRVTTGLVYVDDVVDALLAAAVSDVPTGSVYNLVDASNGDQEELARTLREVTGGRIRPLFAPYPLVWAAMLGLDLLSLVRHGKLGTARYRLQRTLAPMRFECTAARKDLGWRPRIALAEGLARVLNGDQRRPASA
jgi:nucleoside-diphosphate-sugar epimerase/predicted dehydrogenase